MQSGDAEAAVAVLSLAVEHAPAFPDGHVFLGIANALTHEIYPALDHLEEARGWTTRALRRTTP